MTSRPGNRRAACVAIRGRVAGALTAILVATLPATADRAEAAQPTVQLDSFYAQILNDDGLIFAGSARVNRFALIEAKYLIRQMLQGQPAVRQALVDAQVRVTVMAADEFTTDVPEHRRLRPARYWDRRARGLGATPDNPVVSCGEENLLGFPGDPYDGENILIHEFAHAVHEVGMPCVDPDFDARLQAAFDEAARRGTWRSTYAATNRNEYWAEGTQSWFDCNAAPNASHGSIRTRRQVEARDPRLATLLAVAYGDNPWRYVPPGDRPAAGHLQDFLLGPAHKFSWPDHLPTLTEDGEPATVASPSAARPAETATPPAAPENLR